MEVNILFMNDNVHELRSSSNNQVVSLEKLSRKKNKPVLKKLVTTNTITELKQSTSLYCIYLHVSISYLFEDLMYYEALKFKKRIFLL